MDIIENDIQGVIAGKTIYSMILFLSNNQSYGCIHMHSKDGKGAQGGCIRHALPSLNSTPRTPHGGGGGGLQWCRSDTMLSVPPSPHLPSRTRASSHAECDSNVPKCVLVMPPVPHTRANSSSWGSTNKTATRSIPVGKGHVDD